MNEQVRVLWGREMSLWWNIMSHLLLSASIAKIYAQISLIEQKEMLDKHNGACK